MTTEIVQESKSSSSSSLEQKKANILTKTMQKELPIVILPPPASWLQNDTCKNDDNNARTDNSKSKHINSYHNDIDNSSLEIENDSNVKQESNCIPDPSIPLPTISISKPSSKTGNKWKTSPTPTSSPLKTRPIKYSSTKSILSNLRWETSIIHTLPEAARELMSATARRACYHTQLSYVSSRFFGKQSLRYTEVGSSLHGYYRDQLLDEGIRDEKTGEILFASFMKNKNGGDFVEGFAWEDEWDRIRASLPPFSSLRWIDRQLVKEWRTYNCSSLSRSREKVQRNDAERTEADATVKNSVMDQFVEEMEFEQARTLAPQPLPRPAWEKSTSCYACRKSFSSTCLRHHCRLCGRSYCQVHSQWQHKLPHLGYDQDVPERVCDICKQILEAQNLTERIAWRMARCRDYLGDDLVPYIDMNVDTVEDKTARLTRAALRMARSIPLGAQASIAVETLDILRKHGFKGFYGLILRKEFMAAADLLCKVTGINKRAWPLSVHELSAAVFYALAQHRAMRGADPEREHVIHGFRKDSDESVSPAKSIREAKGLAMDSRSTSRDGGDDKSLSDSLEASSSCISTANMVMNENDKFDPMAESVVNLLAGEEQDDFTEEGGASISDHEDENFLENSGSASTSGRDGHTIELESIRKSIRNRRQQAKNPKNDIPFTPVCDPIPDSTLASLIFYAPIAVNFVYAENEVDMQLLAAQQGWRLIYAHLHQGESNYLRGHLVGDMPASALFVHTERKIACFAIRGTSTMNDVVTDIRQMPVQFPDLEDEHSTTLDGVSTQTPSANEDGWTSVYQGKGLALCGMAGAAYNLFRENIDTLLLFARKGYRIRLTGHSMGGSVAALMGSLVLRHFELKIREGDDLRKVFGNTDGDQQPIRKNLDCNEASILTRSDLLRVYGYGSPACVDAKLSNFVKPHVITVVLHDDVVPRLTPTSIRGLLKHLLYIRETWVKSHLANDLMAIKERAKTVWAPKVKTGFSLLSAKTSSLKVYGKKLKMEEKSLQQKSKELQKNPANECYDHQNISKAKEMGDSLPLHDYCKRKTSDRGLYYDGDCFFEAEDSLIEDSDEGDFDDEIEQHYESKQGMDVVGDEWDSVHDMNPEKKVSEKTAPSDPPSAVLLDETPLPRMFIPGKIVHVYTHRGGYKAAFVPRAFRELRRISLAGNMINDHTTKSYYEALLECDSIRRASHELPEWTGYSEETTCVCCASRFTWASTSDSEAQEARDKHNCRSCGSLVCDSCSRNRVPIPSVGITIPSRVCDQCYNDGLSKMGESITLTRSFEESDKEDSETKNLEFSDRRYEKLNQSVVNKSIKAKSKRNNIVDELASRVNSSAFCI